MEDSVIRGVIGNNAFRFFIACSKDAVEKARQIHDTTPTATAALGRLLTASAMMGAMLKNESDLLTLIIKGDGPISQIVATADSHSRIKGYVGNAGVDLPLKDNGKLNISGAVGAGTITVVKDTGVKEPYSSQVPLVSGEIAEDLANYYTVSEQIPSAVGLGVLVGRDRAVRQAGGFIVQALPFASDEALTKIEDNINAMAYITNLLDEGLSQEDILGLIAGDLGFTIHDRQEITYYCNCSKERFE
ncbi:MAG: Hsp33 family molecular chaperone HslO, partial [Clostridiales bacterium]|nr:Hsp33 family molecular chaperone HslO [Clostridiales bacterium]